MKDIKNNRYKQITEDKTKYLHAERKTELTKERTNERNNERNNKTNERNNQLAK